MATLSSIVSGQPASAGTPVVVFMAGFPDDCGSWIEVAPAFEASHTVVLTCMPDYDKSSLSPEHRWGYEFDEIVAGLVALLEEHKASGAPLLLVAHDWGCVFCNLAAAQRPDLIDKLVLMDVGLIDLEFSGPLLWNSLLVMLYQTWLAWAFFVATLTRVSLIGDILLMMFPWRWVGPTPHEPKMPKRLCKDPSMVHMSYPYYVALKNLMFGGKMPSTTMSFPSMPFLYVYGTKKRCTFHTEAFLTTIEQTKGCHYKAFECGHFIQSQMPTELIAEIKAFEAAN